NASSLITTTATFNVFYELRDLLIESNCTTDDEFGPPTEFYAISRRNYSYYWHELYPEFPETQLVNSYHSFNSESYFHHLSKHETTDLIIEVGENPNSEKFRAHTEILSNSTPYFECALSPSWAIFENNEIIFKKPNITPQVFHVVLDGKVHWQKHTEKDILDFLVAADELLIDRILDEGQSHLIGQRYEWILYNLNFITFISFKYKSFEKLRNYCIEKICENPRLIFSSNYFLKFDEEFWIKFLNKDNIQMEEFEIWHNLILWGIGQFSITKNQSFFNFSKNELIYLKSILQHCIPLIRFTDFSISQLYTYVWPFRDIIDLKLRKEIRPAIRDSPNLGPCFGREDIYMTDNFKTHGSCSSKSSSFNDIIFAKIFTIIEYEVFQVVYKRSEENRWVSFMNPKYFENDEYVVDAELTYKILPFRIRKYLDKEELVINVKREENILGSKDSCKDNYFNNTEHQNEINCHHSTSSDNSYHGFKNKVKVEIKQKGKMLENRCLGNKETKKEYKIIISERDQVEQENRNEKIEYLALKTWMTQLDEAL
ncbi:9610_t:CDS:2, partial [Dentiscutata heterogama]